MAQGDFQNDKPGNDQAIKREYFVRQGVDEALLIRLNAFEAEIESGIYTEERKLLLVSTLPASRIAPLFQFIDATSKPRQLDIEVSSSLNTANSEFGIEVTRLAVWDNRSAALARAYRLLSFGQQKHETDSAADWTVKINSLMSAAGTFDQYGMMELRLWSTYLATHLIQYRLHDYNMVLSLSRDILKETRASRWSDIELATLELRSAALIGLRGQGMLQTTSNDPDPVQSSLLAVATRARALGFRFEEAQAIRLSGLEYEQQSLFPQALEQYQLALEIADSIGDAGLAKGIRESMAGIHAGQGDDPATTKVLQEIESRLAEDGGGDELALNLLQQGRIYIRSYRYPQAIKVLLQALQFENNSSIRTQINLELAKAHFETGQNAGMLTYLEDAGIGRQQAQTYFREDYQAELSRPTGFRYAVESRYRRSQSLARDGNRRQAGAVLEELIEEVLFLRQALPGVLGAWYWQRNEDLIEDYLALQATDGMGSLLTLSKLRYSSKPPLLEADTDSLRAELAQRDTTTDSEDLRRLNVGIDQQMKALRALFNARFEFLSGSGVRMYMRGLAADELVLTYHVGASASWVWVLENGTVTRKMLPDPTGLKGRLADARQAMTQAGAPFDLIMDKLGQQLLGPVAENLKKRIYLIPSGQLLGLPFDALRLDHRYLLEQHTVVQLMSFPSNPASSGRLNFSRPENVFLAGHPQDFEGDYAERLKSPADIQAVIDVFVGPGLNIIQGAALLSDEFQTPQYQAANLIHLTMPGYIELSTPDLSSLQLSEAYRGLGRSALKPADIRPVKLNAGLVFLSATRANGRPRASTSQQMGLVSDFLHSGADTVIAGLWEPGSSLGESFITDFYTRLSSTGNTAEALAEIKRSYLMQQSASQGQDWAVFQVFVE
jgi:tetratricopeptide (TPR) repeat protein